MKKLTQSLETFFYSAINGFELLLPEHRIKNKALIIKVYECLLKEKDFTDAEISYLQSFARLTDLIIIPEFDDVKSLIQAETYLRKSIYSFSQAEIRYLLEYLFHLFCKHGLIKADLKSLNEELYLWRLIERFQDIEQNILVSFVHWMERKNFSPRSIFTSINELFKFYRWLNLLNIQFEQSDNRLIEKYLSDRALKSKPSTKERILSALKPFFAFYKNEISSAFIVPSLTIRVNKQKGLYSQLSLEHIQKLYAAIAHEKEKPESALMLYLLIEYSIPLKCLRLIEFENQYLAYIYVCPSRVGIEKKKIYIQNDELLISLIQLCQRNKENVYLFQTPISKRKNKPVSVDYCQSTIQSYAKEILGFEIPAQKIHQDCLKHKSNNKKLIEFIDETVSCPYQVKTKHVYWLSGNY